MMNMQSVAMCGHNSLNGFQSFTETVINIGIEPYSPVWCSASLMTTFNSATQFPSTSAASLDASCLVGFQGKTCAKMMYKLTFGLLNSGRT